MDFTRSVFARPDDHLGQFRFDAGATGEQFLGGVTLGREGGGVGVALSHEGVGGSGNEGKDGR